MDGDGAHNGSKTGSRDGITVGTFGQQAFDFALLIGRARLALGCESSSSIGDRDLRIVFAGRENGEGNAGFGEAFATHGLHDRAVREGGTGARVVAIDLLGIIHHAHSGCKYGIIGGCFFGGLCLETGTG